MSTCWTSWRKEQARCLGSCSRGSSGHTDCSARLQSCCLLTPAQASLNLLSQFSPGWLFNSADGNCFLIPASSSPVPVPSLSVPPTGIPPIPSLSLWLFHSSNCKLGEPTKQRVVKRSRVESQTCLRNRKDCIPVSFLPSSKPDWIYSHLELQYFIVF